jgi:hypothetical protein
VRVLILNGLVEGGFCKVMTRERQEALEVLGSERWAGDGRRRGRGDWGRETR